MKEGEEAGREKMLRSIRKKGQNAKTSRREAETFLKEETLVFLPVQEEKEKMTIISEKRFKRPNETTGPGGERGALAH